MSLSLGANYNPFDGALLNENVLNTASGTYLLAQSMDIALRNHFIFEAKDYFSDVVWQWSTTSAGTSLLFYSRYPDKIVEFPTAIIYTQNSDADEGAMGDIYMVSNGSQMVYAKKAKYEMVIDIWTRTITELDGIVGSLIRWLNDLNHNMSFIQRGVQYVDTARRMGREFDITDKIVQTVSHLDSAIRVRREQIVFMCEFYYRIRMPKTAAQFFAINSISTVDDGEADTFYISTKTKIFIQPTVFQVS
jgi:hypothetical protein